MLHRAGYNPAEVDAVRLDLVRKKQLADSGIPPSLDVGRYQNHLPLRKKPSLLLAVIANTSTLILPLALNPSVQGLKQRGAFFGTATASSLLVLTVSVAALLRW